MSVVPISQLKTRKGNHVKQAWPGGVFTGTILEESGVIGLISLVVGRVYQILSVMSLLAV